MVEQDDLLMPGLIMIRGTMLFDAYSGHPPIGLGALPTRARIVSHCTTVAIRLRCAPPLAL